MPSVSMHYLVQSMRRPVDLAIVVYLGCKALPLLSRKAGGKGRDLNAGFNTTDPIPNVLEDVLFDDDSFDNNQLEATLTALGF